MFFVFIEDKPTAIAAQSRRQRVMRSYRFACARLGRSAAVRRRREKPLRSHTPLRQ
jgi:hypothetical protein